MADKQAQQTEKSPSIKEQLECARREFALRQRVYPKWVTANKMKKEQAEHEMHCMAAIIHTLENLDELFSKFAS
jgi:hypothetical protein